MLQQDGLLSNGAKARPKNSSKHRRIDALRNIYGDAVETLSDLDGFDEAKAALDVKEPKEASNDQAYVHQKEDGYTCITEATMPKPPKRAGNIQSLFIGLFGVCPRWAKGVTVNFATYKGNYPKPEQAVYAANMLKAAADEWNVKLNADGKNYVKFQWVPKLEDAAFVLSYGGRKSTVLAEAFFPDTNDLNTLFVYEHAFKPSLIGIMKEVFLHELGHILGLRHEFADEEGGAVLFGVRNPKSVMAYVFPPQIQSSDLEDTRKFYDHQAPYIGPNNEYEMEVVLPDN